MSTSSANTSTNNNKKNKDIQKLVLKGHKKSVLCLAHTSSSFATTLTTTRKQKRKKGSKATNITTTTTTTTNSSVVDNSNWPCCLLSGSEDNTARLWDLRSSCKRASLCIIPPLRDEEEEDIGEGVTSVAFEPITIPPPTTTTTTTTEEKDDAKHDDQTLPYSHDFTVYLSVGPNVYGYDLRNISTPILQSKPSYNLSPLLQNQDEINSISFSSHSSISTSSPPSNDNNKGQRRRYMMATADDDGAVKIIDSVDRCRMLQHAQDGVAMTTCALFRPTLFGGKKQGSGGGGVVDLVSGGTDCFIRLWDVMRPRRPSFSFSTQTTTTTTTNESSNVNTSQMCNPPMVHSLSWSKSGRLLGGGLGDGTSCILSMENKKSRKLIQQCRLQEKKECMGSPIASVLFPNILRGRRGGGVVVEEVVEEDRLFVTAGNNGNIMFWDLGEKIGGEDSVDPSTLFHGCGHDDDDNDDTTATATATSLEKMTISSSSSKEQEQPKVLFGIPHEHKPNSMVCSSIHDPIMSNTLFVCDTSCDITAYTLPCR